MTSRPEAGTPTDFSLLPGAGTAEAFGTDPERGLSASEAADRLAVDGPNELRSAPPVPLWRKVLAQFADPLVYLLLVAVAISVAAWVVEGAEGVPVDALVIVAVLLANAAIGLAQEARAADAVAALRRMTAAISTVVRDGRLVQVPTADLVVGDLLALSEGDAVGADARVIEASALTVSEASLTGESEPVGKDPATLAEPAALADRLNMVYKGTAVVSGVGRAVVTATGMATEVGEIAELLEATTEEPSPLQREIANVSKLLGITVVVVAVVVMVVTALVNQVSSVADLVTVLLLGVSLAVAAVPEGLPAIMSVVLALGVQAMARRGAVVKKLHSVETLGSASVIASDKTGTLTGNEMTLQKVVTASGEVELTGSGYRAEGDVAVPDGGEPGPQLSRELQLLLAAGAFANNAQVVESDTSIDVQGDPTEAALIVAARKVGGIEERLGEVNRTGEVPFTSERKLMSAVFHDERELGHGIATKGAVDVLLPLCSRQQVGDRSEPFDDAARQLVLDRLAELSGQAYRTLGFAYRRLPDEAEAGEDLEQDLVFLGMVGIIDPPRSEAGRAVADAQRAGIRIVMITGDHPLTAARIASDLGIVPAGTKAVTGPQLDALSADEEAALIRETSVYARVAPRNKLEIVDALQADGQIVAMTGDGVNDAPALRKADIGVAMGITGTEVTKEAARMVLSDDNFATIVAAVRQGRIIFDNIKKFLRYLLSSNMGEVFTVFFGVVLASFLGLTGASDGGVVVPLLATQILWINLVTDSAPALAMGVDPEVDDVMARRPRRPTDRIIDARMWTGVFSIGLVMAVVTLFTIDVFLPGGLVEGSDSLEVARTAGFTTLVIAQLFNALNARSETTTAFSHLFSNHWLWGAIGLAVVLQVAVVELPPLQAAFGTASLDAVHWLVCVGMASAVLWFDELRKLVLRHRRPDGAQ
ncbi:MAG: cation-translocating P-type ATPase [Propionicimonas sp.]|nr:cation-translocating P-type ATPase [Propionicimonas sp.]